MPSRPAREADGAAARPAAPGAPAWDSRGNTTKNQGLDPIRVGASTPENRQRLILAILLAALAALTLASLASYEPPLPFASPWSAPNACGPLGAALAFFLVWGVGRIWSYTLPIHLAGWSWNRFRNAGPAPAALKSAVGLLLVLELCVLAGLGGLGRPLWSGTWGVASAMVIHSAFGPVGSWIVTGALFLVTMLWASELGFHWLGRAVAAGARLTGRGLSSGWSRLRGDGAPKKRSTPRLSRTEEEKGATRTRPATDSAPVIGPPRSGPQRREREEEQMVLPLRGAGREGDAAPPRARSAMKSRPLPAGAAGGTAVAEMEPLPSLSLLSMPVQQEDLITAADLTEEAKLLVTKLGDFDIQGRVTEIHPGPVVTTFEFEPAAGVKVNQIVSREDDLALALRAQRIRILAPIPGKGTVGVEIPNRRRRTVYLREVLGSARYTDHGGHLKVALGVDVVGEPFVADLTRMPHVLVAGATGSGKSVCLNSIITGLLFQHGPDSLRMLMIDPKMLELSTYNGIPHLAIPVVTQSRLAARGLAWAVNEMERRYKLLAAFGVRNIDGYNQRSTASPEPTIPDGEAVPEKLPFIVVIIDELADLMLTAPAEIEEPIARLAQMARAVGIHLVLATQRPSVDVITGVIKANFPSRIAFQVSSKTDSRTVLDMNGAENLLGHGDMLFLPSGKPEPYRVHGAYVSEEETARVVEFWKQRAGTAAVAPLAVEPTLVSNEDDAMGDSESEADDELLREAARLVVTHEQGSTSLLQRRLKVGYARAGRLMDQLEQMGVVGPFQGSKAREVLVDQHWLDDHGLE